jgi:hypothetical protein
VSSLTAAIRYLLDQPDQRRAAGQRAQNALTPHQGAARRQAELVAGLMGAGG